jgi:hypothetical protein
MEVETRPPEDEKPVLVDYEYLKVALKLLFEGIFQVKKSSEILHVRSIESDTSWNLYIENIDETVVDHVNNPENICRPPIISLARHPDNTSQRSQWKW